MAGRHLTIDTLGAAIDGDYGITAHCEARDAQGHWCHHRDWLDLEALAAQLGRDHGCMRDDLVPMLRCSRCGSREVSIRLHPPTGGPG